MTSLDVRSGGGPDIFRATVTSDRKHGQQHGSAPAGGSEFGSGYSKISLRNSFPPVKHHSNGHNVGYWPSLAETHFDHFGDMS